MKIPDTVLTSSEKVTFILRELYLSCGYQPYRMGKFEEYDLYAGNKDFLVSDQVITFTDTDGKLLALKPDVTLSIIKNSPDAPDQTRRVFYNENVYRVSKGTGTFREILQTGVECFGKVGTADICQVLTLAGESLRVLASDAVLAVSDLRILSQAVALLQLDAESQRALYHAISEKNLHEVEALCGGCARQDAAAFLKKLLSLHGTAAEVLPELEAVLEESGCDSGYPLCRILRALSGTSVGSMLYVDFSVTGDVNYYNGIVFKGFLKDVPTDVLSGGQYDQLMRRMGRQSSAIGFAVYTDVLDRLEPESSGDSDGYVNVALPKGRLGEKIYQQFAAAGFPCPSILEPNRKLVFENCEKGIRFFWVKPSDVPIYVERGAADIGVAGKDILLEYEPDVYELLDLKKGRCRMAVAAPRGYTDNPSRTLIVATKFANIAKKYYRSQGRDIDIIHLNGSIEIAPILGLSDVIVDIVETGATLKENNLEVIDTVVPISARLIGNKASFKFKQAQIRAIMAGLETVMEESV